MIKKRFVLDDELDEIVGGLDAVQASSELIREPIGGPVKETRTFHRIEASGPDGFLNCPAYTHAMCGIVVKGI